MKKSFIKESYLLFIIVIGLISLGCYSTYAMFTYSDETGNVISLTASDFTVDMDIMEYETIEIPENSYKTITMTVSNSLSKTMYYGVWYQMVQPLSIDENITIAKLDTSSNDTTGTVTASNSKDVLIIVNNETETPIKLNIGVKGSESSSLGLDDDKTVITGSASIPSGGNTGDSGAETLIDLYNSKTATPVTTTGGESITQVSELGMMQDSFGNIRYYGLNPNNYVTFNGEEEGWRIIGVFNVEDENGNTEQRIKLIRTNAIGSYAYDNKTSGIGSSTSDYGSNDWSDSRLMIMLNPPEETAALRASNSSIYAQTPGLYWNSGSGSCYSGSGNTAVTSCNFTSTGMTDEGKAMIGQAKYSLLGHTTASGLYADDWYDKEQTTGTVNGTHNKEWTGYVGIMYPSDYTYASDLSVCTYDGGNYNDDTTNCNGTNWILQENTQWTISPRSSFANRVFNVHSSGYVYYNYAYSASGGVRPVVYLSSQVGIVDGSGAPGDPYILG